MSAHGGKRPNAGRKPGSLTQKTRGIAEQALQDGISPLEVMLEAMRNHYTNGDLDAAAEKAKDAAPYVHPKLSSVESKNDNNHTFDLPTKIELTAPGHDNNQG